MELMSMFQLSRHGARKQTQLSYYWTEKICISTINALRSSVGYLKNIVSTCCWLNHFFFGELVLAPLETPENSHGHLWSSCQVIVVGVGVFPARDLISGYEASEASWQAKSHKVSFCAEKGRCFSFCLHSYNQWGEMWPNLWLIIKYTFQQTRSAIVPKFLFFIATVGMSVHWNLTGNMKFF